MASPRRLAVLERGGAGVELEELDKGGGAGEVHILRYLHDGTAGDAELFLHFHYRIRFISRERYLGVMFSFSA